jgi:alginate O-acetyltransferase complex protein AlgI
MLFSTFSFALFFLAVTIAHFALPDRYRRPFLLAASYYFYMCWSVRYITVIIGITLIDYAAGIGIEKAKGAQRKLLLALSIASNFGLLFLFKYADFFGAKLQWLLPVGISFHTFQAVSYTIDVYRGKVKAERSLTIYALYVAFFPQMVAGPIERPGHLLPQFHHPVRFDWTRTGSGLRLALWGLIKKTAVADLAAPVVNTVYSHPRNFPGPMLCLATALFAIQIYCDFSGYSDMAVGLARVLGYDLTTNFRQPYGARSIREFWQRWHISLSTWFRDYLYIPLGGNRLSPVRWAAIVMVVFLVSGLWHGANWTFVAWGAVHGLYLVAGASTQDLRRKLAEVSGIDRYPRLWNLWKTLTTTLLVTIAWVFFRAGSISDAGYVLSHLGSFAGFPTEDLFRAGLPRFEMAFLPFAAFAVFAVEHVRRSRPPWLETVRNHPVLQLPVYAAGVYFVVFFGVFARVEFIYFQF